MKSKRSKRKSLARKLFDQASRASFDATWKSGLGDRHPDGDRPASGDAPRRASPSKQPGHVSVGVDDANHLDGTPISSVDDQVPTDGPEENRLVRQVLSGMASRRFRLFSHNALKA